MGDGVRTVAQPEVTSASDCVRRAGATVRIGGGDLRGAVTGRRCRQVPVRSTLRGSLTRAAA